MATQALRLYRVAVFVPLDKTFEYLPPLNDTTPITLGSRVKIPFGQRELCGLVIALVQQSEVSRDKLKPILSVLESQPLFTQNDLNFLHWAADYYFHPLGDVIATALPSRLRRLNPLSKKNASLVVATQKGHSYDLIQLNRAPKQQQLLEALNAQASGIEKSLLNKEFGFCSAQLTGLLKKGLIEYKNEPAKGNVPRGTSYPLNEEQEKALDQVKGATGSYHAFLLDGVTGSGKTDVYIGLINHTITLGYQVLLLVPEIGLTPQLLGRLRKQVNASIGILHSALTPVEKEKTWIATSKGNIQVLIGTRSSIFTPMPNLGLILVDEEHDISFKQQAGFRYSARDLAVIRANRQHCPVVLGSATPSLESLHNVQQQRYTRLALTKRAGKAITPHIDLIDLRQVNIQSGLSPALIRLITATLENNEQVLLFLNRRGYSPVIMCQACGWSAQCHACSSPMTWHKQEGVLWCHHCGGKRRIDPFCPECQSASLMPLGKGTERLEERLQQIFPHISMVRIDRDSTRKKGYLDKVLQEIQDNLHGIVLGTQMLAKGHDFPNVTLAALLDIDQGLFSIDYRASERLAQLLIQVAGRSGRSEKKGRVVIQTHHPEHPLLQTLIHQSYGVFAQMALQERQAANLPPTSYQALIRAKSENKDKAFELLEIAAACAKKLALSGVNIWGPLPAPKEKREGQYRVHLFFQSDQRRLLHHFIQQWKIALQTQRLPSKVRWSIDIDPQDMM